MEVLPSKEEDKTLSAEYSLVKIAPAPSPASLSTTNNHKNACVVIKIKYSPYQ